LAPPHGGGEVGRKVRGSSRVTSGLVHDTDDLRFTVLGGHENPARRLPPWFDELPFGLFYDEILPKYYFFSGSLNPPFTTRTTIANQKRHNMYMRFPTLDDFLDAMGYSSR